MLIQKLFYHFITGTELQQLEFDHFGLNLSNKDWKIRIMKCHLSGNFHNKEQDWVQIWLIAENVTKKTKELCAIVTFRSLCVTRCPPIPSLSIIEDRSFKKLKSLLSETAVDANPVRVTSREAQSSGWYWLKVTLTETHYAKENPLEYWL